jgi:peptidylprolyl isomerase
MRNFYLLILSGVICVIALFVAMGGPSDRVTIEQTPGATKAPPGAPGKTLAKKEAKFPDFPQDQLKTNPSGLQFVDLKIGEGKTPNLGDKVLVDYIGRLKDTKVEFDSSYKRGEPAEFTLGKVIQGWNEGVTGMREGGERVLVIPSELGYGQAGAGDDIPPNADLEFDIKLIKVTPAQR